MVYRLTEKPIFPDPRYARSDGLLAVGGSLRVPWLLHAYRSGIFPWTVNPISWWSPNPRAIFNLEAIHIPRSLDRVLRKAEYRVSVNEAFEEVITACSLVPRRGQETWIMPEFIQAYVALHRAGYAKSVEVWSQQELVGGVYGVAIGRFFAGESMFHRRPDTSKVALVHLFKQLRLRGFLLFDTQMLTPVTRMLGAFEIDREAYLARLAEAVNHGNSFG
jgi:leucyl/phenylalanyl-tRNA---protein transferase